MKVGRGCAALITGASSGIGKALALHLASRGVGLTLVDFDAVEGNSTARQAEEQQPQQQQAAGAFSTSSGDGTSPASVQFFQCDVTNAGQLAEAFSKHMERFGRLDVCVNNAGIGEKQWFVQDGSTDGAGQWRRVVNVNLTAVIDGTRLAIRAMQQPGSSRKSTSGGSRGGGVIVNVASAAGLYPSASGPVYSASKGGVVLFTRSLAHLAKTGVRVNALCPEFIETPLVHQISGQAARHFAGVLKSLGGYIPMATVVEGAMQLIEDDSVAGECMWITNRHGRQWWPTEEEKQRYLVDSVPGTTARQKADPFSRTSSSRGAGSSGSSSGGGSSSREGRTAREDGWSRGPVPAERNTYSHVVVKQLTTNFRSAVAIVQRTLRLPLPREAVLLYVYYAGINASDVNYSAGRYFGSAEEASRRLPFDAGFEAVGVVAAVGEAVSDPSLQPGRPAAALAYGAFGEYVQVEARRVIPVPAPQPEAVALLTSGLTASIALEQAAHMGKGETVLVTAAAGGTGQFAVQLAKLAGNIVVATCGSEEKAALLRTLGADTVIVHSKCDVGKELRLRYPKGVDVVYESVGGAMFQTCLNALSLKGRLVIIGMMSQYTAGESGGWAAKGYPGICEKLLWKSQMLVGFFLLHYMSHMRSHFARLYSLFAEGKLKVAVDPADFNGLASVPDAVDHLQSGRSVGKVIVRIAPEASAIPRGRL